jgi:murein hydrolase activator
MRWPQFKHGLLSSFWFYRSEAAFAPSACLLLWRVVRLLGAEGGEGEALKAVEQDLALSKDKQKQLETKALEAALAQDQLSNQLVALAATAQAQERDLAKVETRLTSLQNDIAKRNLDLAAQQDIIAEVLAGLQRLEHNPPPALVVAPEDVLTALRSAMMFGAVLPELKQKAAALHDKLSALQTLRRELTLQQQSHSAALSVLQTSRADIKRVMAEKQAAAALASQDLATEKKRAEELAAKATSLQQLLSALEAQRKQDEVLASAATKAKLEAERALQHQQNQPQMAFSKAFGQLSFPAQGQLTKFFGVETGFGGLLDGIVIATQTQAQVTAPTGGTIEFAGQFRSFGHMVIINPGEGYLVLLAGLGQVDAVQGQSVKAGEPLGQMGDKASKIAQTGGLTADLTNATTPMLYVEFRHNGDPVDPAAWWIGTQKEAMR